METPVTLPVEIWWWLQGCSRPTVFNSVMGLVSALRKGPICGFLNGLLHLQGNPRDGEDE